MNTADQWEKGYSLGKTAKLGDDLPHPNGKHVWYHAVRAALYPRGMTISMFMRVIPTNQPTRTGRNTNP